MKVVQMSMNLRGILKELFTLAILLAVINGSGGKDPSDKNLLGPETVVATPNESKASNIKEVGDDSRKNRENSPALNSFLRNVLRAQDELEWIDEAVRRVGNKEAQGKPSRYAPESFENADFRYRPKTRLKRRSATELDEFESWPSSKRKYQDEENAGSRHQSVYLEGDAEEENEEEMKVKRHAIPSDFDGEPLSQNSLRKQGRSSLDYRSPPAVDDSTLKRWARREGLKVPGSWLEYEARQGSSDRVNRMDDSENPSTNRLAVVASQEKNPMASVDEQPTLESLKRTILELSRSLAASDRKMEELGQTSARNRERHVEDLAGRKESRTKGEHERAMPIYGGSAKDRRNAMGDEISGLDSSAPSSNWWEDSRSAAEMFDFKRRDDDQTDDEDDDEDSEAGNSEFDYMMQRVKRAGDEDLASAGARVRVYRRAGFGGSYPEAGGHGESHGRRKRSRSEKDAEETVIAKNLERGVNAARSGSYEADVGEIREAGLDKIINVENSDGEEGVRARIAEVNVNENEHNSGAEDKGINKRDGGEKDAAGYNPVEKGAEGGTIGDSNLEDVKTASLSADEKRSPSLRGREEEHEPRLSVAPLDGETPLDESSSNSIKSQLDGLLKNAAIEPAGEKIANEKVRQGVKGGNIEERSVQGVEETSEQIGNEVRHKLSEDSNESKKGEEPNRKNTWGESRTEEKLTENIAQHLEEPKKTDSEGNEIPVFNKGETNAAQGGVDVSEKKTESEEGRPKSEESAKLRRDKESESADKLEADTNLKNKEKYESAKADDAKIKREESTRKLLWLSSESKDATEIRDGRRDSAWDQKDGEKTDQRPANLLAKRSLMMADRKSVGNTAVHRRRKRRRVPKKGSKRSAKSYPENMEDDNAMEEVAREDKEDVHRSESRKRSLKTSPEYRREPNAAEELYEAKYEGFSQINEAVDNPGVSNEDGENALMESETQAESSPLDGSSHRGEDRDPIRDRINMLIKQKLDDRDKEKQAHLKREISVDPGNMEYYDYEGDFNGRESEVSSRASDNEQPQNVTNEETSTSSTSESSLSESSGSSSESSGPIAKKDEITDVERKQALEHEEMNNRAPKQEFLPDTYATTTQKRLTQESESKMGEEPSEGDQSRSKDEEIKNILRGAESSDENNERRENEVPKSNYDQWLAQPIEAAPEEQDTRKDRFQDSGESRDQSRPVENEKNDVLEEPFEYSVDVHGKVDADSIDDILREKPNLKEGGEGVKDLEKSEKSMTYDEQNRDNSGDNERSNDELFASDEHWKYQGIKDKTQSQDDHKVDDEGLGDDRASRPYNEKISRRHLPYKDSARIEEENNAQGSPLDSFSRNTDDQEQTLENKSASKETAEQDVASREARLIDESAEDSLPTMLDRSGPRNLASGEGTYLMIPSVSEAESPRKTLGDNSSSSSSGSNYLALKTTDDLFKGGIEQSNPADEKITEADILRKTTSEWRMGDDPRVKPITGRYPSSPSSASSEQEEMVNPDRNSRYEFLEVGYQELGVNPRDVVHESIVDPEEMAADFDDDLMPRLGRSLQSVSYLVDPFDGVEGTADGERPAEKYLENTQIGFERGGGAGHRIRKRETENSNESSSVNSGDKDSGKKISEGNSPANDELKLTGINGGADGSKTIERRSSESEKDHPNGDRRIDKDKRGLTNVEEWEMNAPDVQKQRTMTRSVEKEVEDLPKAERNTSGVELTLGSREGEKSNADFKTGDKASLDLKSHERETRSIKSKDGNVKPYVSSVGTRNKKRSGRSLSGHRMRSKIRRNAKLYDKFQSNTNPFESSWDSNFRDNWQREDDKIGENFAGNVVRDKRRKVFEKRSDSGYKKIKSNAKESQSRKRRPAHSNYASSNRDEFSHPQHGHRKKTVRESGTNHKHSSREVKKYHNGHEPKGISSSGKAHRKRGKDRKERARQKDVLREGHAKENRKMTPNAGARSRGSDGDFFAAPKAFDSRMEHGGEGRVLDESAEDGGNQVGRPDDEAEKHDQKKKFKVLLAADNMEDESQMDLALHGELAGKIVERIFDQVQKNDALKVALGPGLFRKHKSEDAVSSDKIYRQGLDEDEVKHTEAMMRRVMELLGRLVLDEVQRKTCASLPPDMRDFLQWMLGVEDEERSSDQAPPLPLVHSQEPNHRQDDKFLFGGPLDHNENADLDELNKKVRLLKGLINEYSSLTSKEKTKVQTVHDYLVKQLGLLMSYIDTKEAAGNKEENVGLQGGNILQYQNAMPNTSDSFTPQSTLSPLVNTPSLLRLSNASFNVDQRDRSVIPYYSRFRRRDARNSNHGVKRRAEKHEKHRKHRPHKHKHKHKHKDKHKHEKEPGKESPQYKKLIRKAALLRKKRADFFEDEWDPVNSGYEEPAIYTFSGELANGLTKRRRDEKASEEYDEISNPYFWADVLSGKSNVDEKLNEDDEKLASLKKSPAFEERRKESERMGISEANGLPNSMEKRRMNGAAYPGQQVKRDVLSASMALQPWINPTSNDLVSSQYLSKLTDELVHGAPVPPIFSAARGDENKKRDAAVKKSQGSSRGRNLADEEVMLLSKREAWKAKNEQQLEEVAFGKDMRGKWKDEERFKKLTEMDEKKSVDDATRREKRAGDNWSEKSASGEKAVDKTMENSIESEGSEATAAPREENGAAKGGEDLAATGEEVSLILENLKRNTSVTRVEEDQVLGTLEEPKTMVGDKKSIDPIPDPEEGQERRKDEARNESTKIVSPFIKRESELVKEAKGKDEGSKNDEDCGSQGVEKGSPVSRLVLPWEKMSKISDDYSGEKNGLRSKLTPNIPIDKRNTKRKSTLVKEEVEESAIFPLLEESEQRQQQKQASKAEKDDQRDIADQTLGLESPLVIGLNTY